MSYENKKSAENDKSATIWDNGKSVGDLASSMSNMSQVRKDIIKFALGFEIKDIRTYSGYKGDLLVEIMASEIEVLKVIKARAEELGMEAVLKRNHATMIHELFCITPDEDIYRLAEPR